MMCLGLVTFYINHVEVFRPGQTKTSRASRSLDLSTCLCSTFSDALRPEWSKLRSGNQSAWVVLQCCSAENNDVKMKNAIWSRIESCCCKQLFGTGVPDGAKLNLDFYDLAVEKQ